MRIRWIGWLPNWGLVVLVLLFMTAAAPFALYRFSFRTKPMLRMPAARLRLVAEGRDKLHTVHLFTLSTNWSLTHQWGTNGVIYLTPTMTFSIGKPVKPVIVPRSPTSARFQTNAPSPWE
jgi:hypothetical protein